jgi:tape measure domain-containing protein
MPTIDERVVSIAFENQVFEQRVATTMTTLTKLDTAIKNVGGTSGFDNIEASANKVTLSGPMSALDKLKAKLGMASQGADVGFSGIDQAGNKVTLQGPVSALDKLKAKLGFASQGAAEGMAGIDQAGNKVTLQGPMSALDKLRARLGHTGDGAAEGMGQIDQAGNKVTLNGPITAVDKLQSKMGQLNAGTTFTDIENASSRISLAGLTRALDNVTNKFSVLQGAASVALGGIASQAAMKGLSFAKSFAFAPIIDGMHEYETNLQAIQTIQANTDQPLTKINASLQELNTYSDQTIYNFGEMARNIGTFTAAGVDLKTATSSIKGIANMAALSGSNSQQASTAMYQLSQAIAAGRVGLQDWNSVVNAGMGGKKLQTALATTAIAMGNIKESSVKLEGPLKKLTINGQSFRESISAKPGKEGWLSSDVLVNTLATLDGRFSKAALSAQLTKDGLKKYTAAQIDAKIATSRTALEQKNGVKYTDAQFAALMKLSDSAFKSATEVKTLGQVFSVAKETIGSGWAASFQSIFGNLKEAKQLFTGMSTTINGFINANALARNNVLHDWKALGGRTQLIDGIKQAFADLILIIRPIKDAFRDIFPATTAKQLFNLTKNFHELMVNLRPSPELMGSLKRIFEGLFAVVHIGWTVIKDFVGVIAHLLGVVGKNSGGFLNFVASIGDFLVAVDKAVTKGGLLKGIFQAIGGVLSIPLRLLGALGHVLAGLFGADTDKKAQSFGSSLQGVNADLGPLKAIIDKVVEAWHKFMDIVGQVKTALDPWFSQIAQKFSSIGVMIANAFKGLNINTILQGLQTGLLAGILVMLKKAFGGGGFLDALKKPLEGFNGLLTSFTGKMQAMQDKLHAEALLAIAVAVGVLAAGIYILSTIDGNKLTKAMVAVVVGLKVLMNAMKIMASGMGKLAMAQMPIIAVSLIGLALAVTILAGAMKIFATMSWEDIGKGLVGVAGSIAGIGIALRTLPGGGVGLIAQAAGLGLLAVALTILGAAVKIFASMSWEQLAKGLLGAIGAIAGIGLAMNAFPASAILMGPSLVLIAFGLSMIAGAVAAFGNLKLETIFKGLFGIAASLTMIGLAIETIPPTVALQAAGLIILAAALVGIAAAVGTFGNMKFSTLAKGLIAMGAALVVLGIGLTAMEGTLPGSVALLAAAAAMAILAPTLALMGNLSWGTIIKGLAAMGLTLGVLAVAGLVAAPALIALGGALVVLGAGLALIGAAVYLFAKGISLVSGTSVKAMATLVAAAGVFIAVFPTMVINFIKGIVSILEMVVTLAPKIVTALVGIINQLLTAIPQIMPKLVVAITSIIAGLVTAINNNAGPIISAGYNLLLKLLSGIANNIGPITQKVAQIITGFLNALANNMPKIIAAGANLLLKFLGGVVSQIPRVIGTVARMMATFLNNITSRIPNIVAAGGNLIARFLTSIAGQVPKIVQKGADIIVSFINGVGKALPRIITAATNVATKFINSVANNLVKLSDTGFHAVIRFINGVAESIRKNSNDLWNAGWNLASAILQGLGNGLKTLYSRVANWVEEKGKHLVHLLTHPWEIGSPSKVTIELGKNIMLGLMEGLNRNSSQVDTAMAAVGTGALGAIKNVLGISSPSKAMQEIGQEVNRGFAKGILGSGSDIRTSFGDLNTKLKDAMKTARDTIKTENDKITAELKKAHPDWAAMLKSQDIINKNQDVLNRASSAHELLTNRLTNQKNALIGLSRQYDQASKKLDKANQVLDDAIKKRDSYQQSVTDQFVGTPGLPDKTSKDMVGDYTKSLQDQVTATASYADTLKQLRALGLDDTTYKKLLESGLGGKDFAAKLLATGKAGVDQINALDKQLGTQAASLGRSAAKNLYQAGVNAAQGVVDGLKAQRQTLHSAMVDLANALVQALKQKLKIKSPSQIFGEIGSFMVTGLAKGLIDAQSTAIDAATKVGDNTIAAMQSSMQNLNKMIPDNLDSTPVITPVLDLANVKKNASQLSDIVAIPPLATTLSTDQATAMAALFNQQKAADTNVPLQPLPERVVHFEQNNYSPDPLSNIEIYRQTNNQIAQIKKVLSTA